MYNLVHRIPHGLDNLRELLEEHIHSQGLNALDKCSDSAINVCFFSVFCSLSLSLSLSLCYIARNHRFLYMFRMISKRQEMRPTFALNFIGRSNM